MIDSDHNVIRFSKEFNYPLLTKEKITLEGT